MTSHGRNAALLASLCAIFALSLGSTALAAHDVKIYKNEKHVDITSDYKTADVKCDGTDLAVDGMWRLDHIDQDEDAPLATDLPKSSTSSRRTRRAGATTTSGSRRTSSARLS